MQSFLFTALLISVISTPVGPTQTPKAINKRVVVKNINQKKDRLLNLNSFVGKYPTEVRLLEEGTLKIRLQKILRGRFIYLQQNWAVETPINIVEGMFLAWGCQQHNCDQTNFIIVVDLKKNLVYCGIREKDLVKTYSEDGSNNIQINNWATRH